MRKILTVALSCVLIASLLLSGCEKKKDIYPVVIGDVTIEKAPEKVVILSPTLANAAFYMGFDSQIVGLSDACTFPERTANYPKLGNQNSPDIAAIIALEPDVLLCMASLLNRDIFELEQNGIKVVKIGGSISLSGLSTVYQDVARVFIGNEPGIEKGKAVTDDLKLWGSMLEKKLPENPPSFGGVLTKNGAFMTGDTIESEMFSKLFGENVAQAGTGYQFDIEAFIAADPDYILVSAAVGADFLKTTEPYSKMTAVQEGKIIVFDHTVFERQQIELFYEVAKVGAVVYPDIFEKSSVESSSPESES